MEENLKKPALTWEEAAIKRLEKVPEGMLRDAAMQNMEEFAIQKGYSTITADVVNEKYSHWREGTAPITSALKWSPEAEERISRIPPFVRPMVVKEIERFAGEKGKEVVDVSMIEEVKKRWNEKGFSHS